MIYSIRQTDRKKLRLLIISVTLFFALSGAMLFFAYKYYQRNLDPVGTSDASEEFTIETGDAPQQIAGELEDAGLIRASWAFSWYLRTEGLRGDIQAGTYAISPNQTVSEIATIITGEPGVAEAVTIAPERRLDQIRDELINTGFMPDEVDAALEPDQYAEHPALADKPADASLEGYLYPETFHVDNTTTVPELIEASLDEMAARLSSDIKESFRNHDLSVHEGIILASIVEREVTDHDPEDRPKVAQVLLLRLEKGMKLESNATAPYGAVLEGLDPTEHPNYNSAYNTYRHEGLPPSPISNVTESGLQAVAQPADTDYLYFVSGDPDEDGISTTHFSRTVEDHERLIEEHCTKQCR